MKRFKKSLLFALAVLPAAAVGGYFLGFYIMDMYDAATLALIEEQLGSLALLPFVSLGQSVAYAVVCGVAGYCLADSLGLIRPFRPEKEALVSTVCGSVGLGLLFSLDYWTFGTWIPELNVASTTAAGLTAAGWISAVLYGGVIEEVLLRLFAMSLLAWLIRKLLFRRSETVPTGVLAAANILAALLFAAGHLPTTVSSFGGLTPLLVFRCFLLNGGFGLYFGYVYRRHGIQYAMLSHALLHIVSKSVWTLFL